MSKQQLINIDCLYLRKMMKRKRRSSSMTFREVGVKIKSADDYVVKIEDGKLEFLAKSTLENIAKFLEMNYDSLLNEIRSI